MPWNESEYQRHYKYLAGLCRFTKNSEGGNTVTCDTYSECSKCGWNPKVAKQRADKVRMQRAGMTEPVKKEEPDKWFIGNGEFPRKMSF